jgi:hypothetical protein
MKFYERKDFVTDIIRSARASLLSTLGRFPDGLHECQLARKDNGHVNSHSFLNWNEIAQLLESMSDVVWRGPDGKWRLKIRLDDPDEDKRMLYLANFFDITVSDMRTARMVKEASPEIAGRVIKGELTIEQAMEELTSPTRGSNG